MTARLRPATRVTSVARATVAVVGVTAVMFMSGAIGHALIFSSEHVPTAQAAAAGNSRSPCRRQPARRHPGGKGPDGDQARLPATSGLFVSLNGQHGRCRQPGRRPPPATRPTTARPLPLALQASATPTRPRATMHQRPRLSPCSGTEHSKAFACSRCCSCSPCAGWSWPCAVATKMVVGYAPASRRRVRSVVADHPAPLSPGRRHGDAAGVAVVIVRPSRLSRATAPAVAAATSPRQTGSARPAPAPLSTTWPRSS